MKLKIPPSPLNLNSNRLTNDYHLIKLKSYPNNKTSRNKSANYNKRSNNDGGKVNLRNFLNNKENIKN